jgi:methyl-accepting chemotaxis protein
MLIKVLKYTGMAVVIGLLLQTMVTTYYLGRIDAGLNTSLDSTEKLIEAQKIIIEKNGALHDVVEATKGMDQQLLATLEKTKAIHSNIDQINDWNYRTLLANQKMQTIGAQSDESLQEIAAGMGQLKSSTEELSKSMAKLNSLVSQDRQNLDQMKAYTDEMNRKLPGVPR